MLNRLRISSALVIAVTGSHVLAAPSPPNASAAGTPDISLAVDVDSQTLHGDTTGVSLTASNGTATDGFNLSFRVVLPASVSDARAPVGPIVAADVPTFGETTLFLENVLDVNFGFQEQGLPVTGADLARLVLIGLLLVAAGGILHRFGGRKRSGRERHARRSVSAGVDDDTPPGTAERGVAFSSEYAYILVPHRGPLV